MRRIIFAAVVVCLPALAQFDIYTVHHTASLSAAGIALSVQLPATGSHVTEVTEATVSTSGACSVRLERNGDAANGTNATAANPIALNPETTPNALISSPNITAWYGANIPAGTAITPAWPLPAGTILPFGGGRIMTTRPGITSNYIMRVSSPCTGTVSLFFSLRVRR